MYSGPSCSSCPFRGEINSPEPQQAPGELSLQRVRLRKDVPAMSGKLDSGIFTDV